MQVLPLLPEQLIAVCHGATVNLHEIVVAGDGVTRVPEIYVEALTRGQLLSP